METRRRTNKVLTAVAALFLAAGIASCATYPEKKNSEDVKKDDPQLVLSGQEPSDTDSPREVKKAIPAVLVFGPGMARGFAHAGVIRALEKESIPIGAIVATEMGAVVAALYGSSRSINDFEWKLLKIKADAFKPDRKGFTRIFDSNQTNKKLDATLLRTFGQKTFSQLSVPIRVGILKGDDKEFEVIKRGSIRQALRVALADEDWITSSPWREEPSVSALSKRPFPVENAKELAIGPVIAVDVFDDLRAFNTNDRDQVQYLKKMFQAKKVGEEELEQADLVLKPDLGSVRYRDFKKRNQAIFAGEKVVLQNLNAIKNLVGLGEEKPLDE